MPTMEEISGSAVAKTPTINKQTAKKNKRRNGAKKEREDGDKEISDEDGGMGICIEKSFRRRVPSGSSLGHPDEQSNEFKREYKIEKNGNFAPEAASRSPAWLKHPTWHIPSLEREKIQVFSGIDTILSTLSYYNVSAQRGFLPEADPLQRLHLQQYYMWEDLADDLPKLLSARLGQVREPLARLPVISTDELRTEGELRRAHLLLCLFAHAFVWGGTPVMEFIPKGIAIPLWEVSARLDVPPVLMNMDITLYNWRRLDPQAELNMTNLSTLNSFFSGRDESWFYLITVEIEAIGAAAIVPLMQINSEIKRVQDAFGGEKYNVRNITLLENLRMKFEEVADCIERMAQSLATMREGCHPFIFYHRVRPFLAGWKANPALPNGLKYEGVYVKWEDRPSYEEQARGYRQTHHSEDEDVDKRPSESAAWSPIPIPVDLGCGEDLDSCPAQFFSGGSAAQTALFPFLDLMLGVDHSEHDQSSRSGGFVKSMRQYMPRPHRMFLEHMETDVCIRDFMCACQDALRAEQSEHPFNVKCAQSESNNSESKPPSSSPGSTPPSWIWKGNRDRVTAIKTDGEGLEKLLPDSLTALCAAYDQCLANVSKLRSGHMSLVYEYIISQQKLVDKTTGSIENNAGGRGTGGTDLMHFLKPMRDNCVKAKVLQSSGETGQ